MFEIFTERARRVIFFGRYEASISGSTAIEPEHLLLALIRENVALFDKIPSIRTFRDELLPPPYGPPTPTAIELPLSSSARRVLQHADDERKVLGTPSITTGHLLLGIFSVVDSPSAKILLKYGITHDDIIEKMKRQPEVEGRPDGTSVGSQGHKLVHSSVSQDDDVTLVEAVYTHGGHTFRTTTRFLTIADGKIVNVVFQIRGPSGVQTFQTDFEVPPGTTGAST